MYSLRISVAFLISSFPLLTAPANGIKNFDRVDEHVYRGGQPTHDGFQYLASIGVRKVIDLREADDRALAEERDVTSAGMTWVNVPMTGMTPPTDGEIRKILAILEDASAGPVFIHCERGADRTGAVVAAYHIDHDKWDNARALEDAKAHDMSPFQHPRQNFIREFRPEVLQADSTVHEIAAGIGN
jgi:protein-tyrosine phosphatase